MSGAINLLDDSR